MLAHICCVPRLACAFLQQPSAVASVSSSSSRRVEAGGWRQSEDGPSPRWFVPSLRGTGPRPSRRAGLIILLFICLRVMAAGHLFGRFPSGLIAVPCVSREDGDRQKIRLKTAATVDQTKEFFFFFFCSSSGFSRGGEALLCPLC